ncbi:hypothetical protein [Methylobacterium oryzae]|uniref:Uncharacterized protein n=1 Tax=Methylobacterium oryzae TaxID=334852 RepID=A0ABU7TUF9_9HYPH
MTRIDANGPLWTLPATALCRRYAALVRLGTRPPRAGRFARPPAKPATGLSGPLARWIAHREEAS